MKFEVTETDFTILTSVLSLLNRGGRNAQISRLDIIRESGVSASLMMYKVKNSYLKEKQLKERIA